MTTKKNLIAASIPEFPEVTNVSVYGVFVDVGAATWWLVGVPVWIKYNMAGWNNCPIF